jgi:uncharacterized protein YigA (DUF484 family)
MSTPQNVKQERISANDVHQYLSDHADFFQSHSQLLSDLEIPHDSGKAVSLVEKQVSVLRDQKKQLKKQLHELVQIAKENDALNQKLHALTVGLYQSGSFADVLALSVAKFEDDFSVDESKFIFFKDTGAEPVVDVAWSRCAIVDRGDPDFKDVDRILKEITIPVCGRFNTAVTQYLFDDAEKEVQSMALLPLMGKSCFGLLAIGSYDKHRFHAGKSTEFLQKLAELIGCALNSRL